jgi:putative Mn2+ efflux pump MntP
MKTFLMILIGSVVIGFLLAVAHVVGMIYAQSLVEHLTLRQVLDSGKTTIVFLCLLGMMIGSLVWACTGRWSLFWGGVLVIAIGLGAMWWMGNAA